MANLCRFYMVVDGEHEKLERLVNLLFDKNPEQAEFFGVREVAVEYGLAGRLKVNGACAWQFHRSFLNCQFAKKTLDQVAIDIGLDIRAWAIEVGNDLFEEILISSTGLDWYQSSSYREMASARLQDHLSNMYEEDLDELELAVQSHCSDQKQEIVDLILDNQASLEQSDIIRASDYIW